MEDRVLASEFSTDNPLLLSTSTTTLYSSPPRQQPSTPLHLDNNPLLLSTSTTALYFSLLLVSADLATLHRRIPKME
jgi:hypothetical protein